MIAQQNSINRQQTIGLQEQSQARLQAFMARSDEKKTIDGIEVVDQRGKDMGKDQFLHLLITQLTHQDPMKPIEDKEFIAQMAQFSSLEQMTQVNKNLDRVISQSQSLASYNLLGQVISGIDFESKRSIEGRVKEILTQQDGTYLVTDKGKVAIKDMTKVIAADSIKSDLSDLVSEK